MQSRCISSCKIVSCILLFRILQVLHAFYDYVLLFCIDTLHTQYYQVYDFVMASSMVSEKKHNDMK